MDDLDELMTEAKFEVRKAKKLSTLTPSARKAQLVEAEEAERKRKKKEKENHEDGQWLMVKIFFGIFVAAMICKFLRIL
jgi:hypothetical protein